MAGSAIRLFVYGTVSLTTGRASGMLAPGTQEPCFIDAQVDAGGLKQGRRNAKLAPSIEQITEDLIHFYGGVLDQVAIHGGRQGRPVSSEHLLCAGQERI